MPDGRSLSERVKTGFRAKGIVLPQNAKPLPAEPFPGDQTTAEANPQWLFKPASNLQLHVEAAKQVSVSFAELIEDASSAIAAGWSTWQRSVAFTGVIVNAGVGLVPPGGMVGGPGVSLPALLARMPLASHAPNYTRYATAILKAFSDGFTAWAMGYTCVNLPFPQALLLPGPLPPGINAPIPLTAGMSAGQALMLGSLLSRAMSANLGAGQHHTPLFDAFGAALGQTFTQWCAETQITGIICSGGVGMPAMGALGFGGGLVG